MTSALEQTTFFTQASAVVTPLRDALRRLLYGDDDNSSGWDASLNPTLRSRVLRGIETDHLPTTLYHLPGSDGLRRFVQAARKAGASPQMVARAQQCIEQHERFLRAEGVNRESLHAMVSDLTPEAHSSVVRTNAQSVHKAMCNLIGYSADVMSTAVIVLPSDTAGQCHLAQLSGFTGLQRLRTRTWFHSSGYGRTGGAAVRARTLDGEPIDLDGPSTLLREFCSQPMPTFEATYHGSRQQYRLVEHEIGQRSSSTFYFGEYLADALVDPMPVVDDTGLTRTMLSSIVTTPSKHLHLDVLVHRDVWTGASVSLDTFRTVPHGPVDERELAERAIDRIDLGAALQQFDASDGRLGASKAARFGELLRDALRRLRVSPDALRVFRCEVVYPLYGTQYAIRFEKS